MGRRCPPSRLTLTRAARRDDGCGMDQWLNVSALIAVGHFGLAGIVERVAEFGGSMTIESVPQQGTAVTVIVPL